jgi:hypothetical protein
LSLVQRTSEYLTAFLVVQPKPRESLSPTAALTMAPVVTTTVSVETTKTPKTSSPTSKPSNNEDTNRDPPAATAQESSASHRVRVSVQSVLFVATFTLSSVYLFV